MGVGLRMLLAKVELHGFYCINDGESQRRGLGGGHGMMDMHRVLALFGVDDVPYKVVVLIPLMKMGWRKTAATSRGCVCGAC